MSKDLTTSAKTEGESPLTFTIQVPETIDEAVDMWGEEVCLFHLIGSVRVAAQGAVRTRMTRNDKGERQGDKEILEHMASWKPGMKEPGKSKVEKAADLFSALSEEEKAELLKSFKGK